MVLGIILLVGAVVFGVGGGRLLIMVSEGSGTFFVVVGKDGCRDLLVVVGKDGVECLVIVDEGDVGGLLIIISEGGDGDKLLVEGVVGDKFLVTGGEYVCGNGVSCELDPVGGEYSSELLIVVGKCPFNFSKWSAWSSCSSFSSRSFIMQYSSTSLFHTAIILVMSSSTVGLTFWS